MAYSEEYTASTTRQLEDMFVFVPPRRILELAAASAAVLFIVAFGIGGGFAKATFGRALVLGLIAGMVGWSIPRRVLAIARLRRTRRFNEQLVDSLMNMSNALKAGFSIQQAFESVAREGQNPISQEFRVFLHQTRVGMRMEDALQTLQTRISSDDLTLMVLAIETARQTGGNLTEVFEKIAQTIRERMRIERRIRTLTAQGRLQGIVVGVMPLLLGAAMLALDPSMMLSFLHSGAGRIILIAVAILEFAGLMVIRRIINIDI